MAFLGVPKQFPLPAVDWDSLSTRPQLFGSRIMLELETGECDGAEHQNQEQQSVSTGEAEVIGPTCTSDS